MSLVVNGGLKKGGLEGGEFESTGWGSDLGRQGLCQGAGSQPTTGCGQERRKEKKENLRGGRAQNEKTYSQLQVFLFLIILINGEYLKINKFFLKNVRDL